MFEWTQYWLLLYTDGRFPLNNIIIVSAILQKLTDYWLMGNDKKGFNSIHGKRQEGDIQLRSAAGNNLSACHGLICLKGSNCNINTFSRLSSGMTWPVVSTASVRSKKDSNGAVKSKLQPGHLIESISKPSLNFPGYYYSQKAAACGNGFFLKETAVFVRYIKSGVLWSVVCCKFQSFEEDLVQAIKYWLIAWCPKWHTFKEDISFLTALCNLWKPGEERLTFSCSSWNCRAYLERPF